MIRILAIDPSLTGNGICYPTGHTMRWGSKDSGTERLSDLRAYFTLLVNNEKPDLVVIEDYSYGSANKAHQLGEWGGVLRLLLHDLDIPVAFVAPTALKSWATGKGNAKKEMVVSEITHRAGKCFGNSDEADAWALWAMALQAYGHPVLAMPADRQKALAKIHWPEIRDNRPK